MSDKNTSTLQSYVDSAVGGVQAVIGSITGNASDQVRTFPTSFPISSSSSSPSPLRISPSLLLSKLLSVHSLLPLKILQLY